VSDQTKTTWLQLAEQLGFSARIMRDWRRLPGAPAETDLAKWQEFIKANGLGTPGNRVDASREELLKEKLRKEIERFDLQNDKLRRKLIDREEVNALLQHIAIQARTELYQFLETEAPPKLDGLPAAAQRPILREMADAIADKMQDMVKRFYEE
jgi:hypothetical protein